MASHSAAGNLAIVKQSSMPDRPSPAGGGSHHPALFDLTRPHVGIQRVKTKGNAAAMTGGMRKGEIVEPVRTAFHLPNDLMRRTGHTASSKTCSPPGLRGRQSEEAKARGFHQAEGCNRRSNQKASISVSNRLFSINRQSCAGSGSKYVAAAGAIDGDGWRCRQRSPADR